VGLRGERALGPLLVVAAAGLVLNYLSVSQMFFVVAVTCCPTQYPPGWPLTNFVADTVSMLVTAAASLTLLYFGARLMLGLGPGAGLGLVPLLAVPSVLLGVGGGLGLCSVLGDAGVPAHQWVLLVVGPALMIVAYALFVSGRGRAGALAGAIGAVLVGLAGLPNPLTGFVLRLGWGEVVPAALRASLVLRPEVMLSAAVVLGAVAGGAPWRVVRVLLALPAAALFYAVYELWGISVEGLVLPGGGASAAMYVAGFLVGPIIVAAVSAATAFLVARVSVAGVLSAS